MRRRASVSKSVVRLLDVGERVGVFRNDVAIVWIERQSLLVGSLALDPRLPPNWSSLGFSLQWRGRTLKIRIGQAEQRIDATLEAGDLMTLLVRGQPHELRSGQSLHISVGEQEASKISHRSNAPRRVGVRPGVRRHSAAWTGSSRQLRTGVRETRTGLGQAHGHIPEIGPSGGPPSHLRYFAAVLNDQGDGRAGPDREQ
jgi:Glycosyl hydrolase family 65, C-terminal domain